MKKINNAGLWIIIILVSLLPLLDLLHPGLPVTHDGQDHVARIANFYQSLSEGIVIPRWAANLNWGYGHPILMFLYPLPSYVVSFFHFLGLSLVDSTKLVFAVAFVASLVTMYVWASHAWGKAAGITAAVLYAFAPYRFVDLYVRGAIGEHMAFVFPPLVCFGLLRLARDKTRINIPAYMSIVFGIGLLVLSHNALSLMFLPLMAIYALFLAASETKRPLWFLTIAVSCVILGFMLSSFYWIPAFFEGKYTLRDIVTSGDFATRFVPWISFLYSPWSYGTGITLSKWLGGGQLLTLIVSFWAIERNSKQQRFIIVTLILLFFSLFMQTANSSPIWNVITLLQKFQFPWRLLSITTFLIAVIGASVVAQISFKIRRWIVLSICVVSLLATAPMWRAREYKVYPESFFTGIYDSTTDTGESSPIWSVRFMEQRPNKDAYLFPAHGTIVSGNRSTILRSYDVTVSKAIRFVENTLYFPGWKVYINGVPLETDKLIFQDPAYRGLMTFDLEPGTYAIKFIFTETKLRNFSNYISLGSLVLFVALAVTIHLLWRKRT